MNERLKDRIHQLRARLARGSAGIVAGEIRPPNPSAGTGVENWDQFLAEADGGRFGSIDIWSLDELDKNQFYAIDMPGGQRAWLVVGQILYEPVAVSRKTGEVVLHPQNGKVRDLGDTDQFLTHVVFGDGYVDVIPDGYQDEWWSVIEG